ncbi:hypothetical protein SAMD00019534_080600 [Acytostelium subglobosum LB1]|uniref:hypothetical protein n=1 Tax=Acytostelium subglobosum LB1 TaxID=1410327 RepID=UPI0006447D82|nr:hypothetical protein SAMD00019534_080600 [Acytostelium subglobosum LB1]GAM24885.1 hypothetical protein SAMD00019534_080600 [Acytostelium subglobosum LB1]|eukprot:XP_012751974.1 hypothetical protein SAMD00019534_080600 [Acytostelium subglobosum LB1]
MVSRELLTYALGPTTRSFKFSLLMLQTLNDFPTEALYPVFVKSMMLSALAIHNDFDLFIKVAARHYPTTPTFQSLVYFGIEQPIDVPLFNKHQSNIIKAFEEYVGSSIVHDITSTNIKNFSLKHELYMLIIKVAEHMVPGQQQSITRVKQPMNIHTLKTIGTLANRTPLFNGLVEVNGGDVALSFMKSVKHLMAEYKSLPGSVPIFDQTLLQGALSRGHIDCALYIMDTLIPLLPRKWSVSSIDMSSDRDWLGLVDKLLNKDRVMCLLMGIYTSAIKSRRMDVIGRLSKHPNWTAPPIKSVNQTLSIVLEDNYIEGIKRLIGVGTAPHLFEIRTETLCKCSDDTLDVLLGSIKPGQLYIRTMTSEARMSASMILLIIKHGHHTDKPNKMFPSQLFEEAAIYLGDYDLMLSLYKSVDKGCLAMATKYGVDNARINQFLLDKCKTLTTREIENQVFHSLANFGHGNMLAAHLALPQHLARFDFDGLPAVANMLLASDVIGYFNMDSYLDDEKARFIWSRVPSYRKRDKLFIEKVLETYAAINNFNMKQIRIQRRPTIQATQQHQLNR